MPDIDSLWNFEDPAASEAAFRNAQTEIDRAGDHALLMELLTQIARAQGLQRQYEAADATLAAVEASLRPDEVRARIRYALERGRLLRSSGRPALARLWFEEAAATARAADEQTLAVDALHMIALVEASPEEQLARNLDAVRYAEGASEPKARAWLASLWNNIGMSQHDAGRLDEALAAFERALALRREQGNAPRIRIARWMVAWTHRLLGRLDAALAEQQALEAEGEAAGQADGYVLFELAELHLALAGRDGTERSALVRDYALRASAALADESLDPAQRERLRFLGTVPNDEV